MDTTKIGSIALAALKNAQNALNEDRVRIGTFGIAAAQVLVSLPLVCVEEIISKIFASDYANRPNKSGVIMEALTDNAWLLHCVENARCNTLYALLVITGFIFNAIEDYQ